ncbi:unnamed protein product [Ilex paraguariensis]|uniref:Uncharacterized protein n=1 Tax=Ilex paraguariensis TaxID=185542 RepID=A0ABC8RCI4_9AQUA
MVSCSFSPFSYSCFMTNVTVCDKLRHSHPQPQNDLQVIGFRRKPQGVGSAKTVHLYSYSPPSKQVLLHKCVVPLAASIAVLLCSGPAKAGFLSGSPGIESVPGPQLPQIDFLSRFNEENQKKYAELDSRFKESPLLKRLLEQSKLNKEKNRQEILDKYCIRGAEWGIGDCSAEGMSLDEREKFIAMLKQKAGVK